MIIFKKVRSQLSLCTDFVNVTYEDLHLLRCDLLVYLALTTEGNMFC
jgi:hypothetical protein